MTEVKSERRDGTIDWTEEREGEVKGDGRDN